MKEVNTSISVHLLLDFWGMLLEDGVEQGGKAQAAAQELLLHGGCPARHFVVGCFESFGEVLVDLVCNQDCLFCPIVDVSADDLNLLVGGGTVDLLLPFGIAPFVG